ncbi:MAG: hypothetical protein HYU58_15520 [Proteobacteria bacterium]|nr:hypothetical protein [Pseudomonadota bacterium]
MGVQFRQNSKNMQGVIATMSRGKQPTASRVAKRASAAIAPAVTLEALASIYERTADLLLASIHEQPGGLRHAQVLSHHLDWIGARAQMINSFRQAGDCAMTYICASPEAYARLVPLVELAAEQVIRRDRLAVALYLIERIDEELRQV